MSKTYSESRFLMTFDEPLAVKGAPQGDMEFLLEGPVEADDAWEFISDLFLDKYGEVLLGTNT